MNKIFKISLRTNTFSLIFLPVRQQNYTSSFSTPRNIASYCYQLPLSCGKGRHAEAVRNHRDMTERKKMYFIYLKTQKPL
jgi:hypothetical protein